MTKIIAITGSTGVQGGGVANVLLKTPGWKVRALTRNPNSDKGKDLASRGAEVVHANFDDEVSLAKAFEGVHAIFAVTNFWEHLFQGKSQEESGVLEREQAMKLARAAAKTPTLEHYIWHTLPSAKNLSNGKAPCAHLDYKAEVDELIKSELPELAKKTTFLFVGYYPQNTAFFPMMKGFEVPGSYGKYIQLIPTGADTKIPVSGDMTVTPGIWVRQILANAQKTKGKYADVAPEVLSFGEMINLWSEVTGRQGLVAETTPEDYEKIWGIPGRELADQFRFNKLASDYHGSYDFVSMEELGISTDEAPGFKKTLEGLKHLL